MRPRWDIDERGHGVASAADAVPDLDRLRTAMLEPDWVTEEPEHNLLPHVERLCAQRGRGEFAPHGHTVRIRVELS